MKNQNMTSRQTWLTVVAIVAFGLLSTACSKKLPQEISDLNRTLGQAKDACASVYAADDLGAVQGDVDSMNSLVEAGKYKKAKKQAIPLLPKIESLQSAAQSARDAARAKAEAAVADAQRKLDEAASAEAAKYAAADQRQASAKLGEARAALKDPCRYKDAAKLAADAGGLAGDARRAALEGKRRADEEAARRAAEERRKREAEEEARRRAEEERARLAAKHTVQRGDSLWKIAGMANNYKNSARWPLIYDANRGIIADPDLIYPGQELKIVRDMSEAQMIEKMHRLWRELAK